MKHLGTSVPCYRYIPGALDFEKIASSCSSFALPRSAASYYSDARLGSPRVNQVNVSLPVTPLWTPDISLGWSRGRFWQLYRMTRFHDSQARKHTSEREQT
ncbi:uncharacterized protein LOC143423637 [Xylocopa sonorina]|uniref:uncharacterized protein LOC143423637 n=1 Tax=Xylocopa sonorina TaxID=1818115 RepID=UPI00403A7EF6